MSKGVVEVEVKGVLPTTGGCAVFLGNDDKVFVIYVDQMVGVAITMFMRKAPKERPQTHDLMADILLALGAKVQRVVINHFDAGVYYARLIINCENELQEKKIVEIDARPSDSIALANECTRHCEYIDNLGKIGEPVNLNRLVSNAGIS